MNNYVSTDKDLSFNIDELYDELVGDFETTDSGEIDLDIDLDNDPEFVAGFLKSKFVDNILVALEENNMSQSDLALKLKKSRQYINKVLNEDNSINFTIETMAAISCALGMNLKIEPSEKIEASLPQKIYKFIVQPVNNMIGNSFVNDSSIPTRKELKNGLNEVGRSAA